MKNIITKIVMLAMVMLPLSGALSTSAAALPNWNTSGNYVVAMNYLGSDYAHDMTLAQDSTGNLTGNGGSPTGANVYTWVITSGTVSGNDVDFLANYTGTADAVTPQTVLHLSGVIAANGTMSGNWSDNYQGGDRSGTWATTSGAAVLLGTLAAEDFGVVSYDSGLGMLSGYTAGFGVTDVTFAGATSVVVQLYAGATLLQTNTAILPKFNTDITGTQFSSPFDVSGTFAYATDGYWTNVREAQYGQSVPATRVVATVTLANGKIVTAENTNLVGDPTTIYPVIIATSSISGMKYNDLNRNGKKDAGEPGLSGWVIRLISENTNGNDTLVAKATTDATGNYTFSNVASGTYDVRETHQKGWKRMSKNPKDIVIVAGSVVTDVNFGNATKQKRENEDNNQDDNRDDQHGSYYSHSGRSNYDHDQGTANHSHR